MLDFHDEDEDDRYRLPREYPTRNDRACTLIILALVLIAAACFAWGALAHEARSIAGDPLGWIWPSGCCNSAATHPNGDCALIDPQYVKERPDGYHIDLPIGAHPKLKKKGYSGVVPYDVARNLPTGEYGICLSDDGGTRYCFFAGAKGM